ncbi:MAG: ABC transporter ATP-binding protein [Caulobacteraceae bacterium]
MLLIALLSAAATVVVSLLAAKVAAGLSRDLRGGIFKKVVSFSISEFDKFSTASLITRSTNDIQQIQMLTVMLLRIVFYAPILGIGGMIKVLNTDTSMGWIIAVAVVSILALVIVLFGVAIPKFKYVRNFTQPISQVAQVSNVLQSTAAAAERVFEFLGEREEVPDTADPVRFENVRGEVEFRHVHFGYNREKIIINDFSANIRPGQRVAIVGPTGAGKTTIVKLLMRFYDINSGAILVDGEDIRNFKRGDLRSMLGMVLQDTWLFNGTTMENIRYGRLDADEEEVVKAAKLARTHHFVRTLPSGYKMELNKEASNISQGQKQLLTIARAILADPRILILDEATSSVDTRTEVLIQKAMENLMQGRTSFIIAHRLSTIRDADMILVMKDGDIIEQGNHKELLAARGFYASLYYSQFEVQTDSTA